MFGDQYRMTISRVRVNREGIKKMNSRRRAFVDNGTLDIRFPSRVKLKKIEMKRIDDCLSPFT